MNITSSIPPGQIIVFLGPSLSLVEAKKILPNAFYLPPIRCGDILFALRLKPAMMVIIDGFFEHTAAVWHKEILFALSKNLIIAGASSMGALRAAELAEFGMIGSGKIFLDYFEGINIDDDEVAVLHQPQEFSYSALTDAMVNIRITLIAAYENKIIDFATQQEIIKQAKQLNYRQRTLKKAIQLSNINQCILNNLTNWLETGGFIDQKQQDAKELLQKISNNTLAFHPTRAARPSNTIFFRTLHQQVMCRPFPCKNDWLPQREKVVIAAKKLTDQYPLLVRLAHLLAIVHSFAKNNPSLLADKALCTEAEKKLFIIDSNISDPKWASEHDCSEEDKTAFIHRMENISRTLIAFANNEANSLKNWSTILDYLLYTMRLFGDFEKYYQQLFNIQQSVNIDLIIDLFQQQNGLRFNILKSFSVLWWFIDQQAERLKLFPLTTILQQNSDKLRQQKKLLGKEVFESWLKCNSLDHESYQQFIIAITRLKLVQNQPDILNIAPQEDDVFWLYDALCLTNNYQAVKNYNPNNY